ncbi:hypothetical protein EBU94_08260 [bacterium]|nr:hypothetical protein [bacterium]
MDDGDKKIQIQNIRKKTENGDLQGHDLVSGSIFQSLWVRCRAIFPDITNGKFMESELRYVLYCGIILWLAHLVSKAFL